MRVSNKDAGSQHQIVGARLQKFWETWDRRSVDPWVVQVLREGYRIPFLDHKWPPLTPIPREYPSYLGSQEKFGVLQQEVRDMLVKEAIEPIYPGDPAFYNRLFLVPKPGGKWRPVLDVSRLNKFVVKTRFSMETPQTVQDSLRRGDWMISLDMKDAYFHIPIHPQSRKFLRFVFNGQVFQFRALCFGLSTAPQVFTRVLAPVSKMIHLAGFRIILYLDDWLVLARSKEEVLRAKMFILNLVMELGIIINHEKSLLVPSQSITYLGMEIDTVRFWVSPTQKRIDKALEIYREFWCSDLMPARSWLRMLGHMASLEKFVPGARLRMRPFQFYLKKVWRRDWHLKDVLVPVPQDLKRNLAWWLVRERLERGLSLATKDPQLLLFTDASRKGWGATMGQTHLTGTWSKVEAREHINKLELRAIFYALKQLEKVVEGKIVAVFSDNTAALSYIRKRGNKVLGVVQTGRGDASVDRDQKDYSDAQVCSGKGQCSGRHPEQERTDNSDGMDTQCTSLQGPVVSMGSSISGCLCHIANQETRKLLCSTSRPLCHGCRCSSAGLGRSRHLCLPSVRYYSQSNQQVQTDERMSNDSSGALVASKGVVPRSSRSSGRLSKISSSEARSPATTSKQSSTSRAIHSSSDRLETILRLGRAKGFSDAVTRRVFKARANSTNALYQLRWRQYVSWCRENKLSAIRPSVDSVCKFLIYLWEDKKLAVGTIKGFRSVLHSVLRHTGLDIRKDKDVSDVIRSFILERPPSNKQTVAWNVDLVLKYLCSKKFEPLNSCSIRDLTSKTLFLIALALAKRVSELQALSSSVGFCGQGALLSLTLVFRAKNDNKFKRLPRNFLVKSLQDLVGPEEERKLCPVRALRAYLQRTKQYRVDQVDNLFLAPKNLNRAASKNGLAYLLKSVIVEAHKDFNPELLKICKVKPHEVRAVGTSLSFAHNLSIDSVLEAAQWRSNSVFASFYLKDISIQYENCRSLGPFVAAGTIIN